jgi:hypothetical protein
LKRKTESRRDVEEEQFSDADEPFYEEDSSKWSKSGESQKLVAMPAGVNIGKQF